jgi:hypothetical protein
MEQITIQIKNKQKAQALITFLKSLDFIDELKTQNSIFESKTKMNDADFFALAGIWSGRDVTLETIRLKAWPPRL